MMGANCDMVEVCLLPLSSYDRFITTSYKPRAVPNLVCIVCIMHNAMPPTTVNVVICKGYGMPRLASLTNPVYHSVKNMLKHEMSSPKAARLPSSTSS